MTSRYRMAAVVAVAMAMVGTGSSCTQIAGIREGLPIEDSQVACDTVADCEAEEPACRTAVGCEAGMCVYEDALEGTALPEQTAGDCVELACDGAGRAKVVIAPSDVPNDNNICTLDACAGSTPQHTPQAAVLCYGGPVGTEGKGGCVGGVQQCDAEGNPVGGCEGEVVPGAETCMSPQDEDCDGLVNEEGADCVCGDGYLSNEEECDDGGTSDGDTCSPVCQMQEVLDVVAGKNHTCALLSRGAVKCWGNNDDGQLGLGDTAERGDGPGEMGDTLPVVNVGTGKTAIALAAGAGHTCALLNDGSVKCWGYNVEGELGLGDTARRGDDPLEMGDILPVVNLGTGKTAIALAAGWYHTCALLNDGSVKCWGHNIYGALGLGDIAWRGDDPGEMGNTLPVVNLGTGKTAIALAAGWHHTCALLNDGSVKCWGANFYGQLGLGNTAHRGDGPGEMGDNLQAVNVGTGKTAIALAAGWGHTCALLNDGSVKCWGNNDYGELGLGDTAHRGDGLGKMGDTLPVVNVGTGKIAIALTAGGYHTCALLNDGSAKCWGHNDYGELGLGDPGRRGDGPGEMGDNLQVVNVGTGKTAITQAAGWYHTCALLNDGSVKCWGYNNQGQLGLGDIAHRGDDPGEMGDDLPIVKLFSPFW